MRRPADDLGNSKNRGIERRRHSEHIINHVVVEVDVRGGRQRQVLFLLNNFGSNHLNIFVQSEVGVESSLLANEFLDVFLEDKFARVGECINRVSGAHMITAQLENLQRLIPNNHFMSSYGLSVMAPVSITDYNDSDENIADVKGMIFGAKSFALASK